MLLISCSINFWKFLHLFILFFSDILIENYFFSADYQAQRLLQKFEINFIFKYFLLRRSKTKGLNTMSSIAIIVLNFEHLTFFLFE